MKRDQELIERIRSFNRFYTNLIGLLDQHYLDSPFSLTEGRILFEICNTEDCSAKKIRAKVDIDEGYLSRILDNFVKRGLIKKTPAATDGRLRMIVPTEKGRREFASLNENANDTIYRTIEKLSEQECTDLVGMMEQIRGLLTRE